MRCAAVLCLDLKKIAVEIAHKCDNTAHVLAVDARRGTQMQQASGGSSKILCLMKVAAIQDACNVETE